MGKAKNGKVNVLSFGAKVDGVTDDTDAIVACRRYIAAANRANSVNDSDNILGGLGMCVPAGSLLIKSPGALLDDSYNTRTKGFVIEGAGMGITQILYQPTESGELIHNNDAMLGMRMRNLTIDCDDNGSDFINSYSTGGAQDYKFEDVELTGDWRYGLHLTGDNNNSEMSWTKCATKGNYDAFLYSETSDQFLNYYFDQHKCWSFEGVFAKMTKGGHVKINSCDFSDIDFANAASVLFSLEGNSHSLGVCSFSCDNSRFELKSALSRVMYSEWPQGNISFNNCDESSQAGGAHAAALIAHEHVLGNTSGPNIRYTGCNLLGQHKYSIENSATSTKKAVRYTNCDSVNYDDIYGMFDVGLVSGSNRGALPPVTLKNCRGKSNNISLVAGAWVAETEYTLGAKVRSGVWVYEATTGGTTGTTAPYGRQSALADGTAVWATIDEYNGSEYITDGSVSAKHAQPTTAVYKNATIAGMDGKFPAGVSATEKRSVAIILPPNSIVTRVYINLPAGVLSQGSGTYIVSTDEETPTEFLNVTENLVAGLEEEWTGFFNCGEDIETRRILLEAGTDVTQFAGFPARCIVEYICGD